MKRSRNYEVNFLSKTVTVSRKFMDAATQINSDEFDLLTQFSDMGIRVLVEGRKRRSKPKDDKLPLLTYKMMQDYIAMSAQVVRCWRMLASTTLAKGSAPILGISIPLPGMMNSQQAAMA